MEFGWDVTRQGESLASFQWYSKALNNKASAYSRMFGNMVMPDSECIERLGPIIDQAFDYWATHQHHRQHVVTENHLSYLRKKAGSFTTAKLARYHKNIVRLYNDRMVGDMIGSYLAMVKTGEEYLTTQKIDNGVFANKEKSRARMIMNPPEGATGPLQAIMNEVLKAASKLICGFIWGDSNKSLADRFKARMDVDWSCVESDGSSFDATQYAPLQRLVLVKALNFFRPTIRESVELNYDIFACRGATTTVDEITDLVISNLTETTNTVFIHLPGVNGPAWDAKKLSKFKRSIRHQGGFTSPGEPWVDYLCTTAEGLTFSGQPCTTFVNTLTKLFLQYYDCVEAGIPEPWRDHELEGGARQPYWIIAQGDDGECMIRDSQIAMDIKETMLANSARNREEQTVGLGQIIKKIDIVKLPDTSFCSKCAWLPGPDIHSLVFTREINKSLTTKLSVRDRRLDHLALKALVLDWSITTSIVQAKHSRILEDLFIQRTARNTGHLPNDTLVKLAGKHLAEDPYLEQSSTEYSAESLINGKYELTPSLAIRMLGNPELDIK